MSLDPSKPIPEGHKTVTFMREMGSKWSTITELTGIPASTARRWVERTRKIREMRCKMLTGEYVKAIHKEAVNYPDSGLDESVEEFAEGEGIELE